ncbi:MAG: RNA-guided endonuclease InsQ/TnpB family protein [Candidatus Heimdallarchaeaceae archaeon]
MKEKKEKKKKGEEKRKKVIKNLKKVEKTIKINLYPGRRKRKELLKAQRENTKLANELIKLRSKKDSYNSFHKKVYYKFRDWGFHSQVQQATQRRVFAAKKVSNKGFKIIPLEFNFPRSAKISYSNRGNPLLFVSPYKKRIALPIILDGAYKRLRTYIEDGWQKKSCILYCRKGKWEAHIVISIETPEHYTPEGTVGVDMGEVVLAAVTLNHPSLPLEEFYRGKEIIYKLKKFQARRAHLQKIVDKGFSSDARRAYKTIKKLWSQEKNFVLTRCEQIAHEIVSLAYCTRSAVVVEELRHIRKRFSKKYLKNFPGARNLRRRLNRWIYGYFYTFLLRLCSLYGVPFVAVPARYTSQRCSRCGRVTKSARVTRSLYICPHCSLTVNSDRNASRNIAYRGLILLGLPLYSSWFFYPLLTFPCERTTRFVQFPRWGVIGPPFRRHDHSPSQETVKRSSINTSRIF